MGSYQPQMMRLYGADQQCLYVNADERVRSLAAAHAAHPMVRSLALTLTYTGCRLSEALALIGVSIQPTSGVVTFRTLKRRSPHIYREVPVPPELIRIWQTAHDLNANQPLFQQHGHQVDRITAYRWIKAVMAKADIVGGQAMPKGLRHGFAIHAVRSGVPLNLIQKWMGHASLRTTAIYANASGDEEREIASRMWAA